MNEAYASGEATNPSPSTISNESISTSSIGFAWANPLVLSLKKLRGGFHLMRLLVCWEYLALRGKENNGWFGLKESGVE